MTHPALQAILADEFHIAYGLVANAASLWRLLKKSPEVAKVRHALSSGELTDESIRHFVSQLIRDFQPQRLFPYDLTLAAVAVAVAPRSTSFVDEFLSSLSALNLRELPMAPRVVRHCLLEFARRAENRSATWLIRQPGSDSTGWRRILPVAERNVDQSEFFFEAV